MRPPTYDKSIPLEDRTTRAFKKLNHYLRLALTSDSKRSQTKCRKWAINAAHVVFEAHPELREEGSLLRFFVVRSGLRRHLFGEALTRYVEAEYANGTWYKHVPAELLVAAAKTQDAA